MMSMVWNISVGQPELAPSQLLRTCLSAEYGKLEKVLDFLATAKNFCVLSTFFSCSIQNAAATGKKTNSIPAETRTVSEVPDH